MLTECVIKESLINSTSKAPVQQLASLKLDGLSTNADFMNTDSGVLYGVFEQGSYGEWILDLYKESSLTTVSLVASATGDIGTTATFVAENGSGITGSVFFVPSVPDFNPTPQTDSNIRVICLLSKDSDIQMKHLDDLLDYDAINGFASFHQQAFQYITRDFLPARFHDELWNPHYISGDTINLDITSKRGFGGYDLSRVNNLEKSVGLKEASAHYVLARIIERQDLDPKSIYHQRCKQSKDLVQAYLENINVTFDQSQNRVPTGSRSFSTWKISRA